MIKAHWHVFQILTKRAKRLECISSKVVWPDNVWVGVTVENQDCIPRIRHLKKVPASVRFLSLEPLLGPIYQLPLDTIDWVIVGGESGPGARSLKPEWVRSIRDRCLEGGVPFFFKQWGGFRKARNGRYLDGRTWNQMPVLSRTNQSLKITGEKLRCPPVA
jgi:protein gp37